jgi:Ca-activated chloride channel family protein
MPSRTTTLTALTLTCALGLATGAAHAGADAKAADHGITVSAALDRGTLKAGETQKAYVRVVVQSRRPSGKARAPLNLALVIDRSGSMAGPRIEAARRAAVETIDRLGRDDIVSIVSYDDRIETLLPATKLTDPAAARTAVRGLGPRGSTAIYAGLQAGAAEARKFKAKDRVGKIILLSDGLANVGPSQPADFAGLGRELASEGLTVSTVGLGLGYNEDLMQQLASAADGSHAFIQEPADLAQFLARELDDTLGIVAQDVEIIVTLAPGLKPLRSLGRDSTIDGDRMTFKVNQLIGGVEQVLVAEMEVPTDFAAPGSDARSIATVDVRYTPAGTAARETATARVAAAFDTAAVSEKSLDRDVVKDVTALVVRAERQEAVRLRDQGQHAEAKRKFEANAAYVRQQQTTLGLTGYAPLESERLANEAAAAPEAATAEGWKKARKVQREADGNKAGSSTRY